MRVSLGQVGEADERTGANPGRRTAVERGAIARTATSNVQA